MARELIYTSAPRGLAPGSKGFCTVAMSAGMPASLVARLESLSGYRPAFSAAHSDPSDHLVAFAHWRLAVTGQTLHVLSRVGFAGLDYTQRPNKLAHHLALGPEELVIGGPAWAMLQPGTLETAWSGEPRLLSQTRPMPTGDNANHVCAAWAAATGDAGWAGVLAQAFLTDPARPAYLVCQPGMPMLGLLDEAIRLLPVEQRWMVTFSTCFTDLPAGLNCAWRCCIAGSVGMHETNRPADAWVLDMTQIMGKAPDGPYTRYARTGIAPEFRRAPTLLEQFAPARESESVSSPIDLPPLETGTTRSPVSSRAPALAFWVVASMWPLIVAAAFWVAWSHHKRRPLVGVPPVPPPATMASTSELDQLRAERNEIQRRLTQALASNVKLLAENEKLQKTSGADGHDANWEQVVAERDREIALLTSRLDQIRPPSAPPAVPASQPIAPPPPRRMVAAFPDISGDLAAGSSPAAIPLDLPSSNWTEQPPNVVLRLPVQSPDLNVVPTPSGSTLQLRSKNNVGGEKIDELLNVSFQNGKLVWTWRDYARFFPAGTAKTKAMQNLLRCVGLQLGDGADGPVVQFRPIQKCDFHLGAAESQLNDVARDVHSLAAFGPSLSAATDATRWKIVPDGPGGLLLVRNAANPKATFVIQLSAETAAITSNWADVRTEAERAEKLSHDVCKRLEKQLPPRTDAQIDQLGGEARRQYEMLRDARDDEEQQRAIKDALDGVGEIGLEIVLPRSRVVLYQIRVMK